VSPEGAVPFSATQLTVHQGNDEQLVLYWFQPSERWPKGRFAEELARVTDAVAGRPQYGFVRLATSEVSERGRADLLEFAARIAWPIRRSLDGSG